MTEIYKHLSVLSIVGAVSAVVLGFARFNFDLNTARWLESMVYMAGVVMAFIPESLPIQIVFMLVLFKFLAQRKNICLKNIFTLERFR